MTLSKVSRKSTTDIILTYLRILSLFRPLSKRLVIAVILMIGVALFDGFSIMMMLPFISVIFRGESITAKVATHKSAETLAKPTILNTAWRNIEDSILHYFEGLSPVDALERICLVILIVYFFKGCFTYLLSITNASLEQRLTRDVRNALYSHLHNLSLSFFHSKKTGQIISRITNDVTLIQGSISVGFLGALRDLFKILVFASFAILISWKLALVAFLIVPAITIAISRISHRLRRYTSRAQERLADITTVLQETVSGIRVVKAFAMEKFEIEKFKNFTDGYYKAFMKQQKAGSLAAPMTEFLGAAGALIVLWYGGKQVLGGSLMSAGSFLTFLYFMLSIIHPAKTLSQANTRIQEGVVAAKRVFSILDTQPDIVDSKDAIEIDGIREGIEFVNVSFRYESGEYVLRDINFKVKKGQVVAIVGPSGAGKSTMVDLIPRFYDPTEGCVMIDGIDIRRIKIQSLRRLMGIVTQETILFNDTVRNNIAYGLRDIPFEKIVEAAKAANAHEFIKTLPDGYETIIGDRGVRLSGGERQRIAIARAILKDPQILIFDEATSSLDTESERMVQSAIQRLMENRTCFVIAHRLSTIAGADMILVIDDGRIVEKGNHSELMSAGKLYRRLHDLQFEKSV